MRFLRVASWVVLLENQEAGHELLRFHCADHNEGLTAQVQKDKKCNFPAQSVALASEPSETRDSLRPGRARWGLIHPKAYASARRSSYHLVQLTTAM